MMGMCVERVIKFNEQYPKLWEQTTAELLDLRVISAKSVQENKDLIEYDTTYFKETNKQWLGSKFKTKKYYELPKTGFLIQLIFLGNKNIPFCTLRKHSVKKVEWYKKQLGQKFEIFVNSAYAKTHVR